MRVMEEEFKNGDEAYYMVLERVKIFVISDSRTHVGIEVLTGMMKGQRIEVPIEKIVRPL